MGISSRWPRYIGFALLGFFPNFDMQAHRYLYFCAEETNKCREGDSSWRALSYSNLLLCVDIEDKSSILHIMGNGYCF